MSSDPIVPRGANADDLPYPGGGAKVPQAMTQLILEPIGRAPIRLGRPQPALTNFIWDRCEHYLTEISRRIMRDFPILLQL